MYERVKELCREKGVSVTKLERSLGFSNGSLCKWDVNIPSVDKAKMVADYFGISIDDLLKKGKKKEKSNKETIKM